MTTTGSLDVKRTGCDDVRMNIKQHRMALGLTQRGLAARAGAHVRDVQRWERFEVMPGQSWRDRLAAAVGVSPHDIDWHGPREVD